jgi:DNA-binding response OmpR family regulator
MQQVRDHLLAESLRGKLPALPPAMRLLFVTTQARTGAWLTEGLAAGAASELHLEEAIGATTGLTRLRDEIFDAVLVCHEPPQLDALELVEAVRGSGNNEAIVVVGNHAVEDMDTACYEVGADGYLCIHCTTIQAVHWTVACATQRAALLRQTRQSADAERQRNESEIQEAASLLDQQHEIVRQLNSSSATEDPNSTALTPDLVRHYGELLRAHVMMGSGSLADELRALADSMCSQRQPAQAVLQLHLSALEAAVRGLGNRSARHVVNRAYNLAIELLLLLSEGYRQRFLDRHDPLQQLVLPKFGDDCASEPTI